ncbi:MFS transporter [Sphingomonas sp. KC8]|uniref:MFS transporter n=1 Tax=Sphingomonas sp. KC8 TaxID=1030157 RepID=UPI00024889FC|nr:MFS transporter [Sphingomonas sp. KC8]ARS28882.1 MFS transporter [Sphingomonas sp. KC8]
MEQSSIVRPSGRTPYRGWLVVIAGFTCAMLTVGATIYSFTFFVPVLVGDFGLTYVQANIGIMTLLVGMMIWSPLVGQLIDRLPIRLMICIGAALFGSGFVLLATADSLKVMMIAAAGPIAFGMVASGAIAANAITARWFRRRRGLAIGIIAVATSFGNAVMSPIAANAIESFGWRTAALSIGIGVSVVIAAVALLLMRDRPTEAQLIAGGEIVPDAVTGQNPVDEPVWTLRAMLRQRNFWLIMFGCGLMLASDQTLIQTNGPYFKTKGISLVDASWLVSVGGISAVIGKLAAGWLADHIDVRKVSAVVALCHIVLLGFYIVWPGYWAMLAAFALIGLAIGGVFPVWTVLTANSFGSRSFGTALGAMALGMQPLSIATLYAVGRVRDATGSYDLAFYGLLGMVVLAFILISLTRPGACTPQR